MSSRKTIFIDGEAGTTGLQIRDRLKTRKDIELVSIALEKRKDAAARAELLNGVDVAVLCLPDEAAIEAVSLIKATSKTKVIDASTAFRVNPAWVYGFAEMDKGQRAKISTASRVTNPGCWPQGFIALVKPLIDSGLLSRDVALTYGGVTGYSGGGKKMIEDYLVKGELASEFTPYALTFNHKHLPEMKLYTGMKQDVLFQPVVGDFAQGMLTTVPLFASQMNPGDSIEQIHDVISAYHVSARFVEVVPLGAHEAPNPEALNNSNRMRLSVYGNEARGQFVLMANYDNLGKGASGAAVQNLNLMIGADEALSTDLAV